MKQSSVIMNVFISPEQFKKITEVLILNFDDLFCIPPSKELLLVAMEMMISMILKKKLVNRLLVLST